MHSKKMCEISAVITEREVQITFLICLFYNTWWSNLKSKSCFCCLNPSFCVLSLCIGLLWGYKIEISILILTHVFFSFVLSLFVGESRICLPDHLHNRNIYEDHCLWLGDAPKLLRQKRLEHAGFCHCHCGVSMTVCLLK